MIKHETAIFTIEESIKRFEERASHGYCKEYMYGRIGGLLHAFFLSEVITSEEFVRLDNSLDAAYNGEAHHA